MFAKATCIINSVGCADVNFHSSPGPTMLLAAVGAGSADVVNFLLEIGADPNVHDGVIMALSLSLLFIYFML